MNAGTFHLHVDQATLHGAGLDGTIFYGLRAFGPNWPWSASFAPGSSAGLLSDVIYAALDPRVRVS